MVPSLSCSLARQRVTLRAYASRKCVPTPDIDGTFRPHAYSGCRGLGLQHILVHLVVASCSLLSDCSFCMALPILPDDTWERETMPKTEVEDEATAQEIPDTQWTTSIWSAADTSKRDKPHLIQGPRYQGHVSESRVEVTAKDSRRICRKIDKRILAILVWVYFLQVWCLSYEYYSRSMADASYRSWINQLWATVRSSDSRPR